MQITQGLDGFLWTSMSANNCNTYLIQGPARVLIDPGHLRFFDHVERGLREAGLEPADIDLVIATHAHPDHVEAVKLFKDLPTLFAMHETDWRLLKDMGMALGVNFDMEDYQPDFFLDEGNLQIKGLRLQVLRSPGHSPGSVSIYWPEAKALLTGDVLFKEGLGRVDLPGGNGAALKESIRRLSLLETEWLCPGHGGVVAGRTAVSTNFSLVEKFWFAYI